MSVVSAVSALAKYIHKESHLMDPHCQELHDLSFVIEKGLKTPLEEISNTHLNHSPSPHKMSIGQLAIHCMGWAQYFLADEKWEPEKWTCVKVDYPLTLNAVLAEVDKGFEAIRTTLQQSNDQLLEVNSNGEKGHGYIIYRLLIHAMCHANQMAYLRQTLEPDWTFGTHFGDMASAVIVTKYHTTRDLAVPGF